MAKTLGNVKITVENLYERYEFTSNSAAVGSETGGADHYLTTGRLFNMKKYPVVSAQAFSSGGWSIAGLDTPAQSADEKALIGAGKAQERAALRAARLIEQAHEQAEAIINDADHTLNMALMAYMHTGKSEEQAASVLLSAGIGGNDERAEQVARLEVEELYLLDTPEFLKVD